MTGRRPVHTRVYDNGHSFRKLGVDAAGLPGARWVTLPQHFKEAGWTTLGGKCRRSLCVSFQSSLNRSG